MSYNLIDQPGYANYMPLFNLVKGKCGKQLSVDKILRDALFSQCQDVVQNERFQRSAKGITMTLDKRIDQLFAYKNKRSDYSYIVKKMDLSIDQDASIYNADS